MLSDGSSIQPTLVIDGRAAASTGHRSPWHASERRIAQAITLQGPIAAGSWVQAELPIGGDEPDSPIEFFDPGTFTAIDPAGEKVHALVDYYRTIYEPYEQTPLWGLGDGNAPGSASRRSRHEWISICAA